MDINNVTGPSNISDRGQPIITEHKYTRTLCLLLRRTRIEHSPNQLHPAILNHKVRNSIFGRFYYTIIALLTCNRRNFSLVKNTTSQVYLHRPNRKTNNLLETSSWATWKGTISRYLLVNHPLSTALFPSLFAEATKWPPIDE